MTELSIIGESVTRVDALEKTTGRARYTSDVELFLPGLLYGKVLYSPHAHAGIMHIDTSRAERLPGVKIVLTGKDAPSVKYGHFVADRYLLAKDRVRFIGDAVAVAAAESPEIAEEALRLIKIDYQELPAIFDPEAAMKPDCPVVLHPELASYERPRLAYLGRDLPGPNVHTHHKVRRGSVAEGFRNADLVVENRFTTPRMIHCQLEPYNSFACVAGDGTLNIWSSTHQLFSVTRNTICHLFGLSPEQVRARSHYIGGNFGAQPQAERFAALLALKTGKPVRVTFTRTDCFIDGLNRFSTVAYIKDGVRSDGTLVAREIKLVCNGGAYTQTTPMLARNAAFALSAYRIPNVKWDAYGVYTNEPPSGPLRGFGCPETLWAVEQQMDIIAAKLSIDPVAIRQKNLVKEGEKNVRGEIVHSIGAQECLDKVARWIDWGKPTPPVGSLRIGKGLALGNKYSMGDALSAAVVKVHPDGVIEVRHGGEEVGQGTDTILAQIAAEEFRIPLEKIRLVSGDTASTPYDYGAVSSRSTFNIGNVVRLACQDAKRQLFEMAADKLGASPEDLEAGGGKIFSRRSPERVIPINDLFLPDSGCPIKGGAELLGQARFIKKTSGEDPETGQGNVLSVFYTYGAQAAEVAVDVETGQVKLLRFASAFDMGRPINPVLCEAQMQGGAAMGISSALYEGLIIDKGRLLNPSLTDYRLARSGDVPTGDKMGAMIVSSPHKEGPFGAKGIAEATIVPTAPAIANAVFNAVGVRIKDLPITPEKVLASLQRMKIMPHVILERSEESGVGEVGSRTA